LQSGLKEIDLYKEIATRIRNRGIGRIIGIGSAISANQALFHSKGEHRADQFFSSTDEFLLKTSAHSFKDEYILLKGARVFEFEKISHWLEQKVHQTVLEINLSAMAQNLKTYQQQLAPQTKLMAMVKAFSYGSGSAEVARLLQFHKVDYLAVAYADEGVELRKAGISLPIMVMSPDEASFDALVTYDLEPEIYSFPIYRSFHIYLEQQAIQLFPVHIKFNTGMNRLGFEISEAEHLAQEIRFNQTMAVRSVFSHLVSSEAPSMDSFTQKQVSDFESSSVKMKSILGYSFIRHIANSSGISRHPAFQFDMVRLGIGLYGVDSNQEKQISLETVLTLKTTIAQIRKLKKGETVGYSRAGVLQRDSLIATVRIGYADGYDRRLGKGKGAMLVNGERAPVVGQVCMDMTMIDVTDINDVKEGDEVEVFGKYISVNELAQRSETIPYEVMTGISQRVKRVYLEE
jgi:alanine racemase